MFGTKARRGMAVSALVFSLSVTSLVGSAAASPSADETNGCSVLAHERNAGAHRLHDAWQGFNAQLRDLSRETRDLSRESRRSGSATELTVDARGDIADAKSELNAIRSAAHAELQDRVELGTVCKEQVVTETEVPPMTVASLVETDVDDEDDTVELSLQTNDLVEKYREVVDQAITDMQAVMDPLNAEVTEMLDAAATAETTDDAAVTEKHGKAKADRETKKSGKPEGAGKPADKGGKGKAPRG